ncbi:cytochrome P450 [Lasiosphaeria ovina]|uniref:Cytochrome P450 n=1 Tax=Lasiosphaeria ovina TaxID=92902 RepID=A0AAE0KDM6_9PEZI|nr:cytochrome P450 [Lasiosphaeria ovina]
MDSHLAPSAMGAVFLCALGCWAVMRAQSGSGTKPRSSSILATVFETFMFLQAALAKLGLPILGRPMYRIRGPKNVADFFHNTQATVNKVQLYFLHHGLGLPSSAADVYLSDNSGARPKPIIGSSTPAKDRFMFIGHQRLVAGLLQGGLAPATARFERHLAESLLLEGNSSSSSSSSSTEEVQVPGWQHVADLEDFFRKHIATSLFRALFGDKLLELRPTFVRDVWELDRGMLGLLAQLPRFCIPQTYKLREELLATIKTWHALALAAGARGGTGDDHHTHDADSDPHWGTGMMRERYRELMQTRGQDEESMAAYDLSLIWGTMTNAVPAAMTLLLHILRSKEDLLPSLHASLSSLQRQQQQQQQQRDGRRGRPTIKDLESIPLLSSMYAETLRYGMRIDVPRTAPYADVAFPSPAHYPAVDAVVVPRGALMAANMWDAHGDERVWDTKSGAHPVDSFWARRFLVDPRDPSSGPAVTTTVRKTTTVSSGELATVDDEEVAMSAAQRAKGGVHFSLDGLDGAWIPYGGGLHACPGRLLAKRVILISVAMLVTNFDFELLADEAAMDLNFKAPMAIARPTGLVPFRMRRREDATAFA